MEEILASIRRIISDDVAAESAARPVEAAAQPTAPVLPVMEAVAREAAEPVAVERPVVQTTLDRPTAAPVMAAGAEPRSFRPLVTPAPRVAAGYSQPAPRRPLGEPLAARAPVAARPAPTPVVTEALVEKVPAPVENDDLDAPFAAALLDLAMVEQAVQAELAAVPLEAFAEAALDHDETIEPAVAAVPTIEPRRAEASTGSVQAGPATVRNPLPQTPPEAVDMQVQAKPAPLSSRPAAATPVATTPAAPVVEARPVVQPPRTPEAATLPEPARLVSSPTNTAVAASFGALARTVASNSRSVEDVVTEAIRPMLKSWLDENLPALVERLVRAEIERVARQG